MVYSGHTGPRISDVEKALAAQEVAPPPIPEPARLQGAFFWRRVFARSIDLLFTIPFGIVLAIIVYIPIEIARALTSIPYMANFAVDLVVGHVLFLLAIILHDSCALAMTGTTIGKALFGIRITKQDGSKPRFSQAMGRTEKMLRSHFYLIGFPILMWPFVASTFSHIKRTGSATWDDRANTVLSVRLLGAFRLLLAGAIGVVVLMGIVVADRLGKDQTKAEFRDEVVSEMLADLDAKKHPPVTYEPSRYSAWETVSVPGICTFQIPPTMELQAGKYRAVMDQYRTQVLQVTDSGNRVVAQQKGLNQLDPTARSRYARVIVETQTESTGDFNRLGEPLPLARSEVEEIDDAIKSAVLQEAAQSTAAGFRTELTSWGGIRVVRVNGIDCLLTKYSRSVNGAPAANVCIYKLMNNDRMHTVSVSYRTTEADLWADDLDKIITTFQFVQR